MDVYGMIKKAVNENEELKLIVQEQTEEIVRDYINANLKPDKYRIREAIENTVTNCLEESTITDFMHDYYTNSDDLQSVVEECAQEIVNEYLDSTAFDEDDIKDSIRDDVEEYIKDNIDEIVLEEADNIISLLI